MLRATFIGWQSWLLESGGTCVLTDPLLHESAGRGSEHVRQDYYFWPPRRFDWNVFPAVETVVLSHEHEDHFNVLSLDRIDRSTCIALSARASDAALKILETMGFSVTLVYPGDQIRCGPIEVSFFGPKHVGQELGDEWDTLSYLAHVPGEGSFFTNVDIPLTPEMTKAIEHTRQPKADSGSDVLTFESMTLGLWNGRAASPQAPTNHRPVEGTEFAFDSAQEALHSGRRIRPLPGQSAILEAGRLARVETRVPYLSCPPRDKWPQAPGFWAAPDAPLHPRCGFKQLPPNGLVELEQGLTEMAEFLYGGRLFRRLYSLNRSQLAARKPTFLWLLFADEEDGYLAYEYHPQSCHFRRVEINDRAAGAYAYIGVVSAWATDLLCLFRGAFEPRSVARNMRAAFWAPCADVNFYIEVLWPFFHPLRHPRRTLEQYLRDLESQADRGILIRRRRTGDAH